MNQLDNQAASVAVDSLINYETVKFFNNEQLEVSRYEKVLERYDRINVKTISSLSLLNWGQNLIFSVGLAVAMYMAAKGYVAGVMTLGDMVMVNGLIMQLSVPLNFLGSTYREARQALIDMSTMFAILDLKPKIANKQEAKDLVLTAGEISFNEVRFSYDNKVDILKSTTFVVPAGKKVAIVGTSGGGFV